MKDGAAALGMLLGCSSSSSIGVPPPHRQSSSSNKRKPNSCYSPPPKPATTLLSRSMIPNGRLHLKYYAELGSKLAQDGRFQDLLMIAEALSTTPKFRPSQFAALLNADLVSTGISGLLKQPANMDAVVAVLNSFRKLGFDVPALFDAPATQALTQSLALIHDFDQLVYFMETLRDLNFSIEELVDIPRIIRRCVNNRDPAAAIRIAQIFPRSQKVFCTIIFEFGKKADLPAALTVFQASKQTRTTPNMFAYRTILDVCALCGDYVTSRSIYQELLACKCTPNVYVYNSLMNVNACDLRYTLQVYKQMKRLGVRADLASYNILLKSCCLAARVDLARDIYREVRRLEAMGALKLDVFTYSTIIKVFADAKMWQMALNVKEDMLSAGVTPNTVTWTSLISASANAGLVEQTILLFEEMLLAGCTPSSQCFNILLHACVEAFQYDRAFRLFQSWKENGCHETYGDNDGRDKHFRIGIDTVERNGVASIPYQTSAAHSSLLPLMVPFKPTTSTYNTLMKACGTDYYRAKGLMDEMKKMGLSPNHISWSILIDICGGSGNVEGALLCRS